jgi:hypothetical protein
MEKDFIPYDLSLRMKAIDFNEPCLRMGMSDIDIINAERTDEGDYPKNSDLYSGWVSIPTYLQVFRWFRDNYNLYHNIDKHGYWFFEIKKDEGFGDLTEVISVYDFDRYEEAELQCLIKLIEVVEKWN